MDSRDEEFLRDLAWSEAWFPWKKKNSILVRGRERNFWEPFAVIVSAAALFVSALSAYGTWRQVTIMQDQITAGDRNRTFQIVMEKLNDVCKTVKKVPLVTYEDPQNPNTRAMIKEDVEAAYIERTKIGDLTEKAEALGDSMRSLGLWLTKENELEMAWEIADRYVRAFEYKLGQSDEDAVEAELLRNSMHTAEGWAINHAFNLYICDQSSRELITWFRTGVPLPRQVSFSLRLRSDWN